MNSLRWFVVPFAWFLGLFLGTMIGKAIAFFSIILTYAGDWQRIIIWPVTCFVGLVFATSAAPGNHTGVTRLLASIQALVTTILLCQSLLDRSWVDSTASFTALIANWIWIGTPRFIVGLPGVVKVSPKPVREGPQ